MEQRFDYLCEIMVRSTFTHKFKNGSPGRTIQNAIHTLEDDIIAAEQAALTLDIEGYYVMFTSGEIEDTDNGCMTGTFYDSTPSIMSKIDMRKIILKAMKQQIIKWKAELVDKYAEYKKLISEA